MKSEETRGVQERPAGGAGGRTGLFFCRCGPNVGRVVRIDELEDRGRWPGAADVATHSVLCSAEGRKWLAERIRAHRLERVVVAACSPREHEQTFRAVLAAEGLSPFLLQMANLREQVEWLGGDSAAATAQAARLVRAALSRLALHRPLPAEEVEVSADVLVVGAGAAGVSAAVALAGRGRRVIVAERAFVVGGLANLLDQVFPRLECASCFMEPILDRVLHHPGIEVLTGAEVRRLRGTAGRFEVEIALRPRGVDPAACLGCGECAKSCPAERPDPYAAGLASARAIGIPYPGCLPHVSVLDAEACLRSRGTACDACRAACAAGAVRLDARPATREVAVGAIVLATGLAPGEVAGPDGLVSSYRLERMLHPSGPTAGALRGAGGRPPAKVLLAADADEEGDLASLEILKLAHLVKSRLPEAEVAVAGDLGRVPQLRRRAAELEAEGIVLLPGRLVPGSASSRGGALAVRLEGGDADRRADLVIVHGAAQAAPGAGALARLLRVPTGERGFYLDGGAGPFEPTATRVAGVYVVGGAAGPRTIGQAIRDGAAAAGLVHASLVPGERRPVEPLRAEIDDAPCGGCGICASVCPFGAICVGDEAAPAVGRTGPRRTASVAAVHCRGCGVCAAACPTGAASARHSTRAQIAAEIGGLLDGGTLAGRAGKAEVTSEPRIVAFLCNGCAYQAADRAGQAKLEIPHSLLPVRVMCTGRVEPAFVLQAFREGADGVLVAGCHPGECHHVDGNLRAAARHALLTRALAQAGIEPSRFRVAWAGGSEAAPFARIVGEMTDHLRALGPLDYPRRALHAVDDAVRPAPRHLEALEERPPAPVHARPRIALYWNASCGGCEEAVIDLGEGLPALLAKVEVVLWPAALDFKRRDVEALPDGGIDVAFVSGAVRLAEQAGWARLLRRKSRILVAFGACAHMGGVVGLGNTCGREEILDVAYRRQPSISNAGAALPGEPVTADGHDLSLPVLLSRALPLGDVVEVDYVIPGCPPSPAVIEAALERLLSADRPPRGAVLAPNASLCERCPRAGSRPERIEVAALRRLATSALDPERCFLAQGVVCLGPGTRQGCQPGCVEAGMPCRGCFGPLDGVRDAGAAMLSAFASLLAGGEHEVAALAGELPDPAGTFWRYSFAAGLLPRRPRSDR